MTEVSVNMVRINWKLQLIDCQSNSKTSIGFDRHICYLLVVRSVLRKTLHKVLNVGAGTWTRASFKTEGKGFLDMEQPKPVK
jgi:hypothetical protein